MAAKDREFGSFGNTKPVKRRGRLRKLFFLLLIVGGAASVPFLFPEWRDLYVNFLEKEAPQIETPNLPAGLGSEGMEFRIAVSDKDSGIDEVVVRAEQNDETRELFRKRYSEKQNTDTIVLNIPGKSNATEKDRVFDEGEFRLTVTAFDRSFWTTPQSAIYNIKVDYSKPKIEVLTTQHNAVLGGAEFVFYRVIDSDPSVFSGVKAGEYLFPGFLAKDLDPEFQSQPNLYFAFFPIPSDFDSERDKIRIFARDAVGNIATAGIYYRVANVKFPTRELKLSEQFIRDKVEDLLPKYYALDAKVNHKRKPIEVAEASTKEELFERFRLIQSDYRALIERLLATLYSRPKAAKLWHGPFSRQAGAAQQAGFGEKRKYSFEGVPLGESTHWGVDLASTANSTVRAANSGIVIFADDLGIYGNTIILDHGFGLTSLYGHLSSMAVAEGDSVVLGQDIGRSGNSGFAEGDHLHFEIRLHGIPVRPIEWWDAKWLNDHIDLKIEETKKALGISVVKPVA